VRLWKVLDPAGLPVNGGAGQWNLGGGWMPRIEGIEPCQRGYHLCRTLDVLAWGRTGTHVWEVEADVEGMIITSDKVVVHRARLVRRCPVSDRQAREFAADCAERVLPVWERDYPQDARPRRAIQAARDYALGLIDDAAGAAAGDAAWAAAWAAAGDAAWAAARDAAGAAARAAAGAAAWAAAWDAARAAARDAAGAAAWAAAWAAEREWQRVRLEQYLDGTAYAGSAL